MTVSPSELRFFTKLEQEGEKGKPLDLQTIQDHRESSRIFINYAGLAANISFENRYITARDGYKIPIRIYNNNLGNQVNKILIPGQTHNTMLLREAMYDGVDLAKLAADVIQSNI